MLPERGSEPVVGWRVWNLSDDADGPLLWPAGSDVDPWPRRRPIEARCVVPRVMGGRLRRHEVPDLGCWCGVYAGASLAIVARGHPAWPPATVIGRAALWGRTVSHEHGWRSRFAYPERLRLVCTICAWIAPGRGEPEEVHKFRGRLYGLCGAHGGGFELPDGRRSVPIAEGPKAIQDRLLDAYAVDLLPAEPLESLFARPPAPEGPAYVPSLRLVGPPGA